MISQSSIDAVQRERPELHRARRERWIQLGISAADAFLLARERDLAEDFEAVVGHCKPDQVKRATNWGVVELPAWTRPLG